MQEWYRSQAMYSAVMKLLQEGRVEEAVSLVESIPLPKVRLKALSNLILAIAEREGDVRSLLERFYSIALSMDYSEANKAFLSLALSLLEKGRIDEALEVARHVPDVAISSKIKAQVAIKLAEIGEVEKAMAIIEDIVDEDVKTWAMSMLASKL